jgi:hypothetical protein
MHSVNHDGYKQLETVCDLARQMQRFRQRYKHAAARTVNPDKAYITHSLRESVGSTLNALLYQKA